MKLKEFFALADTEFSANISIQIDDITFETKDYVSNEDIENTVLEDFEIEKFSENENGFTVHIKVSK